MTEAKHTPTLPDLPDLKQLAEWSYGMSRSVRAACRVETVAWDELSEEQQWALERIASDALTKGMEIGFSDPRLIGERNKWFNEAQTTKALLNEAAEVLREVTVHQVGDQSFVTVAHPGRGLWSADIEANGRDIFEAWFGKVSALLSKLEGR